ncbi:MAG: rod shape-determining protein MreD [Chloroflexota bacterium]
MTRSIYIAIPLMFLLAILQTAVWPHFTIFGMIPSLPLLFALCWAVVHQPEDGIMWGFIAGLLLDLFSISYVGISSLTFVISVTAVVLIADTISDTGYLTMLILTVVGTLVYILSFSILLRLWGLSDSFNLILTLLPLLLLHAILVLPIYWGLRTVRRLFVNERVATTS